MLAGVVASLLITLLAFFIAELVQQGPVVRTTTSHAPAIADPVLHATRKVTIHEVTSFADTPQARELEIRDTVERLIGSTIQDWSNIEPVFEEGHLTQVRIHRDGRLWPGKVHIVHPLDQFSANRRMQVRILFESNDCSLHVEPFLDGGKDTGIYMLAYVCKHESGA